MAVPADKPPLAVLTPDEEVTLRRVAFGQSEVRAMRAADLDRLRRLSLIENGKDGPQLTAKGKNHFEALKRAAAPAKGDASGDLISTMDRLLKEARR
jgi:hypothetical protein